MVVAEQVQEVQTRHKTQFWSSSNFVLMFKLHPIFYSVAPKCKTSPALNINFSCIRFPSDGPLLNKASKKVPTQKLKIMVEDHICFSLKRFLTRGRMSRGGEFSSQSESNWRIRRGASLQRLYSDWPRFRRLLTAGSLLAASSS